MYTDERYNMRYGENLYYFDKSRHNGSESPAYYQKLIESATESLWIWDSYFWRDDVLLFNNVTNPIEIKVLRQFSSNATHNPKYYSLPDNVNDIIDNIPNDVKGNNKKVQCAFIDKYKDDCKKYQFHDRYLIIDESRVFAVGASLSYQYNPGESFGIYKIGKVDDISLIIKIFNEYFDFAASKGNVEIGEY